MWVLQMGGQPLPLLNLLIIALSVAVMIIVYEATYVHAVTNVAIRATLDLTPSNSHMYTNRLTTSRFSLLFPTSAYSSTSITTTWRHPRSVHLSSFNIFIDISSEPAEPVAEIQCLSPSWSCSPMSSLTSMFACSSTKMPRVSHRYGFTMNVHSLCLLHPTFPLILIL